MSYDRFGGGVSAYFGGFLGDPAQLPGFNFGNRCASGFGADVRIPLQHPLTHVTHHIKHGPFRDSGFPELCAERMTPIMQPTVDIRDLANPFPCSLQPRDRPRRVDRLQPVEEREKRTIPAVPAQGTIRTRHGVA